MDILASKLFKSSSRQSKIKSAVMNPINAELVKQITNYVDPQYREDTAQGQDIKEKELKKAQEEFSESVGSDNEESSSDDSFSTGSTFHGNSGTGANGHFDAPEDESLEVSDQPEEPIADNGQDEVSEATDITDESYEQFTQEDVDSLKLELENAPDTSGVARIQLKDDTSELWIYYNDKINLNSIMESVISKVDSMYSIFDFNRLARTDNAIVFTMN